MEKMAQRGAKIKQLVFSVFLIVLAACNSGNKTESTTTETKKNTTPAPSFNADSAFNYVKAQTDFGPRIPNSTSQAKCADWLSTTMKQFADTVIVQSFQSRGFDGKTLNGKNIISSFNPSKGDRIMLCAHWDTRPFADQDSVRKNEPIDGANDGASGVGILIEVARQISIAKPDLGIDIIFFDLEDYGQPENSGFPEQDDTYCLGSQYWSQNLHTPNYFARYGVLLDMVGATNATFTQEGTSMRYAENVTGMVWKTAGDLGYGNYFLMEKTNPIVDDHYYINQIAEIKCTDVIHYDYNTPSHFWKHWHTHGDTIDKIDKNSLKAVGQTLLQVLFNELSY
jgi:glutaminyl-peptide cyclotransferase